MMMRGGQEAGLELVECVPVVDPPIVLDHIQRGETFCSLPRLWGSLPDPARTAFYSLFRIL